MTKIIEKLFTATASFYRSAVYLLYAKPVPVCQAARHRRVRLLRDDGLTPGNYGDRRVAECLIEFLSSQIVIGDPDYY